MKRAKIPKSTSCLIDYMCCPKESKEKKYVDISCRKSLFCGHFLSCFSLQLFAFIYDVFGNCCLHAFRPFRGHLRPPRRPPPPSVAAPAPRRSSQHSQQPTNRDQGTETKLEANMLRPQSAAVRILNTL